MISTVSFLSLVAFATAQSSTVSLFLPYADPQDLVASIAGSDATATEYVIGCPSAAAATSAAATADLADIGDNECGFPTSITVTQGPSTVHYALSFLGNVESVDCKLFGTTQAFCTVSASGDVLSGSDSIPPVTSGTLSGSDVSFLPVVITAGSATAKPSKTGSGTAKVTGGSSVTGSSTPKATASSAAGGPSQTSGSATAQGTNAAVQQGASVFGAGIMGALGVAVAGAVL